MSPVRRTRQPDPTRILNYTTTIEAATTVGQIKAILQAHKARSLTEIYDDHGEIAAVEFVYETSWGPRPYVLPARVDAVLALMIERHNAHLRDWDRRYWKADKIPQTVRDQAKRTAWRTIKDWVEAQMALMATRQVAFEQIFLSYAIVDETGRTVFDVYNETQKSLPGRQ